MNLNKCSTSWNYLIRRVGKLNTFLIFIAIILIIYNELLCYSIMRFNWRKLSYSKNSVKILYVADPQLIGYNDEPWWLGPITRWDSDEYLIKGFNEALNHVQPDVVVFLGDLFDEGSSSTDIQYENYIMRFNSIFKLPEHIKTVFVPGDNDLEGNDFIENRTKDRFVKYFPSVTKSILSLKFIDILKFDAYGRSIFQGFFNNSNTVKVKSTGKLKIFCNHVLSHEILENVMKLMQPNLVVTGHTHESYYISCAECTTKEKQIFHRLDQGDVFISKNIAGNDSYLDQIFVPSCNYRMGFPKMGYGFLELDYSGQMYYTVLWLPGRYPILYSYVFFCLLLVIILIFGIVKRLCKLLFTR